MASGDTAAIDTIDVESALSTKNSEYTTSSSNYNKDQLLHEQDEYGKFIKDTPGKQVLSDGVIETCVADDEPRSSVDPPVSDGQRAQVQAGQEQDSSNEVIGTFFGSCWTIFSTCILFGIFVWFTLVIHRYQAKQFVKFHQELSKH